MAKNSAFLMVVFMFSICKSGNKIDKKRGIFGTRRGRYEIVIIGKDCSILPKFEKPQGYKYFCVFSH